MLNSAVGHKRAGRRHAAGVCCSEKYLDTIKIFETTRDNLNTKLWLAVMLVLALALLWPLEAASLRNCSQPLGMEDGRILDTQISASSSYQETLVGPDKEASTYSLCPLLFLFFTLNYLSACSLQSVKTKRWQNGRKFKFLCPDKFQIKFHGSGPNI